MGFVCCEGCLSRMHSEGRGAGNQVDWVVLSGLQGHTPTHTTNQQQQKHITRTHTYNCSTQTHTRTHCICIHTCFTQRSTKTFTHIHTNTTHTNKWKSFPAPHYSPSNSPHPPNLQPLLHLFSSLPPKRASLVWGHSVTLSRYYFQSPQALLIISLQVTHAACLHPSSGSVQTRSREPRVPHHQPLRLQSLVISS